MTKHILYLASGSGRRFGSNKLLHPIDGKPMFQYGLELLRGLPEDCAVTVVSRYAEIREEAQSMGFFAVDAPDSEQGVSHTIRAGLSDLYGVQEEDYLLFLVADQPYLTRASLDRLLALADGETECGSMCYGNQPGNPTLFSARLFPELMALEGDRGGRAVLKKHNCIFVPVDSAKELEDIDTQ